MPVFTTLETTRLRLRHFTDADLVPFIAYRNDPEVARYQSWEGISSFAGQKQEVQEDGSPPAGVRGVPEKLLFPLSGRRRRRRPEK